MKRVGIIAGSGNPPARLAASLETQGMSPYIVALDGITSPDLYQSRPHLLTPIGMAGAILSWLKQNGVTDVVMTGSLNRPEWSKLKVDARGMKIVAKVALKALGDDGLLRVIRAEIEKDGLQLRGIQYFMPEMLAPAGVLGQISPLEEDRESIEIGLNAAREHGRQDKGQSVVVQQGSVLGLEGNDGTKALLEKAAKIKSTERGPILVKLCKPQQDRDIDLPTIGTHTVEVAHRGGYAGIVVSAGDTLIVDLDDVIALCDQYGLFLCGVER